MKYDLKYAWNHFVELSTPATKSSGPRFTPQEECIISHANVMECIKRGNFPKGVNFCVFHNFAFIVKISPHWNYAIT